MDNGHLGDERIQELAAGAASGADGAPPHLFSCPACRQAFDGYRALFGLLAEDPGFAAAPDLAERVLRRLPENSVAAARARFWRLPLTAAVLLTPVVPFLFVSPRPLLDALRRLLPPLAQTAAAVWQPLHLLLQRLNGSALLLCLAALAFLLAGLADHWLRRRLLSHSA